MWGIFHDGEFRLSCSQCPSLHVGWSACWSVATSVLILCVRGCSAVLDLSLCRRGVTRVKQASEERMQ